MHTTPTWTIGGGGCSSDWVYARGGVGLTAFGNVVAVDVARAAGESHTVPNLAALRVCLLAGDGDAAAVVDLAGNGIARRRTHPHVGESRLGIAHHGGARLEDCLRLLGGLARFPLRHARDRTIFRQNRGVDVAGKLPPRLEEANGLPCRLAVRILGVGRDRDLSEVRQPVDHAEARVRALAHVGETCRRVAHLHRIRLGELFLRHDVQHVRGRNDGAVFRLERGFRIDARLLFRRLFLQRFGLVAQQEAGNVANRQARRQQVEPAQIRRLALRLGGDARHIVGMRQPNGAGKIGAIAARNLHQIRRRTRRCARGP